MARVKLSPFGRTRTGFIYDTRISQYVNTRTGEIVDAANALLQPDYETTRFESKEGYKKRWTPERDDWLIHQDHALSLIRRELRKVDPDMLVNIRGLGGSVLYPDDWWTTQARSAEDLLDMDDDELAEWCFRLENPAFIIEVAVAED